MNLLEKCENCKLKECIECEYTYSDLKETIEHLQKENEELRELKYKLIDKIEEKRKALRHRTPIEEILEYEFVKLRNELLEEE